MKGKGLYCIERIAVPDFGPDFGRHSTHRSLKPMHALMPHLYIHRIPRHDHIAMRGLRRMQQRFTLALIATISGSGPGLGRNEEGFAEC